MVAPSVALAIAEHSMCQPGRPGPQGLGQLGSPGLLAFQTAKSAGSALPGTPSSALRSSSTLRPLSLPYSSKVLTENHTEPSAA